MGFGQDKWRQLRFDGNDYLSTNNNLNIQGNASRTVSVWFNPSNIENTSRGIVSLGIASHHKGFDILVPNTKVSVHLAGTTVVCDSSLQINNWYLICGSFDGQKVKIFVNGVQLKESANLTLDTQLNNVRIGNARYSTIGKAQGIIDDVRIYDRALSSAEVQALYNLGQ